MSVIDDIVENISWWERKKWDIQFKIELYIYDIIGEWYQQYIDLFWLHYYGFYPTAIVKSYLFETTFLFESKDKAKQAFHKCEKENGRAVGWYYEVNEFKELVDKDKYYNYNDLNIWWVYEN